MKRFKTTLAASACAMALTTAAQAGTFDIPAGDLNTALSLYIRQSGAMISVSDSAVKGIRTKGVKGDLPPDQALTRILSGTGFIARDLGGSLVIIRGNSSAIDIQPLQLAQANPNTGRIEEVLVTARKREEAIENIPISITALNAEDLKSFGVRNFADLEGVVPGLNMGGGGNGVKRDSSPFIRGVGQRETKVTLDPAVATYIDGIYIGRAAGAMLDVTDVANIQVLRGPQGTLFGRNATGGAISVTLQKPTNDWQANVTANIGNFGRRDLSGMINMPFIDDMLMGRLFVSSTNSNGFFTNTVDNSKWGGDNRITGIAQLRFLPTDRITIDVLGEKTRIRETPRPQRCAFLRPAHVGKSQILIVMDAYPVDGYATYEGLCRRSEALPPSLFSSDAAIGGIMPKGRYWVDTSTAAVTANWDIGNLAFLSDLNAKSISAWRKTRQIADEDLDAISATYLIRIQPDFDETIQWSQELQISGKTFNDRLFVSTGVYYFKERTPGSDLNLSAGLVDYGYQGADPSYPNGFYGTRLAETVRERLQTDNWSFAWFGQADFDITPEFQLTAGLRWTVEDRWSRYSKANVIPESIMQNPVPGLTINSVRTFYHELPGYQPALSWQFCGDQYRFQHVRDGLGLNRYSCEPGAFVGDDLRIRDSAWTPMASLKYNVGESMLQRLSLDQAMLYVTYSQGFHSGGVTAGAIDNQRMPANVSPTQNYIPGPGDEPCPLFFGYLPQAQCAMTNATVPSGYGAADPIRFRPEKVTNYEIGLKMAGLDRRLQANLTGFYMQYTDMQTTAVGTRLGIPVPFVENVGKSIIKGIEAEIVAMPTPEWRITMNGSYTDADIKEWFSHVVPLNFDGVTDLTMPEYDMDRSDERMPRVPRWQFFASTDYNFRLPGGGSITPSLGVRFTSSIYHGFDRGSWVYSYGGYYYNHGGDRPPNRLPTHSSCTAANPNVQCGWNGAGNNPQADRLVSPSPDYKWKTTSRPTAFLDGRLSWISGDGKMEAALWGKNLTNNDDYLVGGIPLADVTGATGQVFANPRTFGLTFTYHFGE